LAGEQIPIAARIASVADVFDALTHKRSYKEAWPVDQAIDTIKEMRGLNFDPVVVDAALLTIESLIAEHGYEGMDALLSARAAENPTVAARAFFRRSFQSSVARAAS
jgi:HD-GYP domain-containing protein (c-di-GMP phosphodiesterase class II)